MTIAGPLHRLLAMRLGGLTPSVIEEWAAHEAALRPTVARLAWRHLKAFLSWCAEQPAYAPIVATTNPAKTRTTRESLGKARTKDDALLREQLNPWFDAVLAGESTYPKGLKQNDVFDLLRRAERAGYLARVEYRGADRKARERWEVTHQGRTHAGLPAAATAATAATYEVLEVTAPTAVECGDCGDSARGYGGKSAHTKSPQPAVAL